MSGDFEMKGQQGMDLFTGGSNYGLWIRILSRSDGLKLKHLNADLFLTNTQTFASSQDVNSGVDNLWHSD